MNYQDLRKVRFIRHTGNGNTYLKGGVCTYWYKGEELNCIRYTSATKKEDMLYLRLVDDFDNFVPADMPIEDTDSLLFRINPDNYTKCKLKIDGEWVDCDVMGFKPKQHDD